MTEKFSFVAFQYILSTVIYHNCSWKIHNHFGILVDLSGVTLWG